jgi:hypothetical protein
VYLAMANWLNEIKNRIFVPITSEIGSETNWFDSTIIIE